MRDTLLALYELQQIDLRTLEVERVAEQIPAKVSELERQLEGLRVELGTLNSEADALRAEQREAEAQIRDDTAKIHKWKRRLNDIKTPREYQALAREVEQLERGVRDLEEKVMTVMQELEDRDKVIADKSGELKERESGVAEQVRALRQEQAKLKAEAIEAGRGRGDIVAKLDANMLKRYERVRDRRQGMALALTTGGTCTGCNVAIRPQLMVEIRRLDTIEQCPTCQRILMLDSLVKGEAAG